MADKYAHYSPNAETPSRHAVAITPADGNILADIPKALYVGGAGDITMVGVSASAGATGILFKGVPAGAILPFCPREIKATGTTATNIVGLL